jgi:hypothetical protein
MTRKESVMTNVGLLSMRTVLEDSVTEDVAIEPLEDRTESGPEAPCEMPGCLPIFPIHEEYERWDGLA